MSKKVNQPPYVKFAFGGTAGIFATCVTQPLDLIKNRMQLSGQGASAVRPSTLQVIKTVLKNEGFFAFYNGLSAGVLRQATYTTGRLGIYNVIFDMARGPGGEPPNFLMKILIGCCAGGGGALIGTPAEVALIRMTSDGRLPLNERRNYKSVVDALVRIVREEGVLTLWRGVTPTVGRAMVVNAAQLSTYSQAKQQLLATGYFSDNINLHFWASMISGLVTTIASMPVDIAKTRIQSMKTVDGKPEFKGTMDVLVKLVKNEGVFALWKGFTPYYARLGPHTVLTFIFLEQLNTLYQKYNAPSE